MFVLQKVIAMLGAISGYFSGMYAQTPGQTVPEKVSYVARQAFKTLPWVAAGATIYTLTPPKLRSVVVLGSMVAMRTNLPPQPFIGFLLVGNSIEFKNHLMNLLKATQISDRIALFAKAYVAFKFASISYSRLFNEKSHLKDSRPLNPNTTLFAMAVTMVTIGGMLYYNRKLTLIGLSAGILINMLKPSAEDLPFVENLVPLQKAQPTYAPLGAAEKIAYIWDAWNIFARTVGDPSGAVYNGALQGRKLEWYYSYLLGV